MKKILVCTFVFATLGLIGGVVSAILFFINADSYGAVGAFSTIVSIILGVVSMVYTFSSGKETSDLFQQMNRKLKRLDEQIDEIGKQNEAFVAKIKMELSKDNFDQANIDNIKTRK